MKTVGPVPATNWSVIEANTGLICTCLPMLNQYIKVFFGFFGRSPANISSVRPGNTPRSGKFFATKTDKSEIFGTGRQWGAVDSTVESGGDIARTESQENMVGDKAIHRTVDVEMWHTDGRSDESLKI
jgi:Fungal rhodopsin domain